LTHSYEAVESVILNGKPALIIKLQRNIITLVSTCA